MHLVGPFRCEDDGHLVDGAHTHRFVVAEDELTAQRLAVEALKAESKFQSFRIEPPGSDIRVEVRSSRPARWLEGLVTVPGFVFYSEAEQK